MLGLVAVIVNYLVNVLETLGEMVVGKHPIDNRLFGFSRPRITPTNIVITLPYFVKPAADFDAFLVHLDGLLPLSIVAITICQIKCVAVVIGLLNETFGKQSDVACKLVCLGSSVANIINERNCSLNLVVFCSVGSADYFVGDTPIRNI